MKSYLVDSGALLAMLDIKDAHHVAATNFIQSNKVATFYLPETIFAETMVLTKSRLGAKPAIALGNSLMKSNHFKIIYLTRQDRSLTWDIFARYVDKDWSYVDCSIMAIAYRLKIFEVFSFDHHINQMAELTRLPFVG